MDPVDAGAVEADAEQLDVRLRLDMAPEWSWASSLAGIPQLRAVEVSSSHDLVDVVISVTATDGENVVAQKELGRGSLRAGVTAIGPFVLRLDPKYMAQREERAAVEVNVSAARAASPMVALARVAVDVDLQPADLYWWHQSQRQESNNALLAAFVRPNSPVVRDVAREASLIMEAQGLEPSFSAYQAPSREVQAHKADETAWAVASAIRRRGISYAEPPPAWDYDGQGQRIRPHDHVAIGGLGTCLDTTVLFAACLEHVGLHPVLLLVHGHAFAGYWRVDSEALDLPPRAVVTDHAWVANQVQSGLIGLVETTALTLGNDEDVTGAFRQNERRFFRDQPEQPFRAMIDVRLARSQLHVIPLPAVEATSGGELQIVEYRPEGRAVVDTVPVQDRIEVTEESARVVDTQPARIRRWKSTLLTLNATSPLLSLPSNASVQPLVLPPSGLGRLEDSLHEDVEFEVTDGYDVPPVFAERGQVNALVMEEDDVLAEFSRKRLFVQRTKFAKGDDRPTAIAATATLTELRALGRKARDAKQERGMNPLFLVLGGLRWSDGRKDHVAPIILVPVHLTGGLRGRPVVLSLDTTSRVAPNYALIEWLRREHDLVVPGLSEPALDKAGIDVQGVLQELRDAASAASLSLTVVPTASLTLLDVGAFRMWKDLVDHGEIFLQRPLVKHLVQSPTEPFQDPAADVEVPEDLDALVVPVQADSAQLRAVAWARAGRTFVLQGPPGTGKSQTITNMIAACVQDGKRVLFVAEKQTALSVVQRRLDQVGLSPFVLNLHHEGSSTAQVRDQLKRSLKIRVDDDPTAMEAALRKRRAAVFELKEYPHKLHEPNDVGLSAYAARDRILLLGDGPTVDVPSDTVRRKGAAMEAAMEAVREVQRTAGAAKLRVGHPWRLAGPASPDSWSVDQTQQQVLALLTAAAGANALREPVRSLVLDATGSEQLQDLALVSTPGTPVGATLDSVLASEWIAACQEALVDVERTAAQWAPAIAPFSPSVLWLDLPSIRAAFVAAGEGNPLTRKNRRVAALEPLRAHHPLQAPVDVDSAGPMLDRLIGAQGAQAYIFTRAAAIPGVRMPAGWAPLVPGTVGALREALSGVATAVAPLRGADPWAQRLRDAARVGALSEHHEFLTRLAGWWAALTASLDVRQRDLGRWTQAQGVVTAVLGHSEAWRRDVEEERLLGLQRWMALQRSLVALQEAGLDDMRDQLLDCDLAVDLAEEALERGVAEASLRERLTSTGLDLFDGNAHAARASGFAEAQGAAREQWRTSGPALLLAERPSGVGKAVGAGPIGALARELEKTRGLLGTRALMHQHGKGVQLLMPVVLISPSNAVDLLHPGDLDFDVVIFDEASQITVPEAVGAMGRAGAVIVVGDSKQMPPTRRVGVAAAEVVDVEADDLDAEEVVEDEESILSECELARVPTLRLDWHYRSQDEALIAFSNQAYYEGALSSFPTPTLLSTDTGVEFRRVEGRYIRAGGSPTPEEAGEISAVLQGRTSAEGAEKLTFPNTNPREALAILAEVGRLIQAHAEGKPSIGIVTFNEQQKALITALLVNSVDAGVQRIQRASEMGAEDVLFVKSLEQVQGDERDVVLFSVAFSKQANGKIPLNFGRLSQLGGHRRLNVAVTRARRKNLVFCSFEPGELEAERSMYLGVRHLKEYLQFARQTSVAGEAPAETRAVRDRHRDDVAAALRDRGVHVRTDVGMSDFRLDLVLSRASKPEVPILPVLLDGELWRRRETVGDRDVLPVEVLTGLMGWPSVARVWWPMWLQNRQDAIESLLRTFEDAAAVLDARGAPEVVTVEEPEGEPPPPVLGDDVAAPEADGPHEGGAESWPVPAAEPEASAVPTEAVQPDAVAPAAAPIPAPLGPLPSWAPVASSAEDVGAEPRAAAAATPTEVAVAPGAPHLAGYLPWSGSLSALDELTDKELADALVAVVSAEGPMHAELAYRRLLKASGGSRLGPRIKERLNSTTHRVVRAGRLVQLRDQVKGQVGRTLHAPGADPVVIRQLGDRSLEDVPRSEVRTLAVRLGYDGAATEEAKRAVLAAYDRKMLTQAADAYLTSCFTYTWD